MLEASPPLEDGSKETSSLSSHNASRCSTPSISHFDGTPLFLLPHAQPSSRRPDSSSTSDMAIKPNALLTNGHTEHEIRTKAEFNPKAATTTLASPIEHPIPLPLPDEHIQEPVSRSVPSLNGLSQLLRQEKYQSGRGRHVRAQLYRTQLATARTSRLLTIARSAQQTLAECIRSEDKQSFVNLHNAFQDAVTNSLEPPHEILEQPLDRSDSLAGYPGSFVDILPSAQRTPFLNFLSKLKGQSTYVADRLSSLTHSELLALLPERASSKSNESVFESSGRSASRASRHLGYVVDSQTELLTSCEPSSPLGALMSCTRSLNRELRHDPTALDIWATACERLISDHKRGGEKIVPAVIDLWASSSPWPGKQRLEDWIGDTLQAGAFILNQPSKQSFRVRVQGRPDPSFEDEGKAEMFFSKAVQSLLEVLADPNGVSAIPDEAILLCQHVCDRMRLSFGQRDAFCNFVLTRWLFNSFVVDAITLPETHAMATARFIPDNARQRILREVVIRTQKDVFGVLYPWKNASPVSSETASLVHAIARRFQGLKGLDAPSLQGSASMKHSPNGPMAESGLFAISLLDASALIDALYPQRRPASLISDSDVGRSGLQSSASSVSGFSLFASPNSSHTTLVYPSSWPTDPVKGATEQETVQSDAETGLSEATGIPSQDEVEESLLRDVRASIEEMIVSGRFRSDRQFAILCFDGREGTFETQSSRLENAGPDESLDRKRDTEDSTSLKEIALLREVLPELLDDLEYESPYFLESSIEQDVGLWLRRALEDRANYAKDHGEFVTAHLYTTKLSQCETLLSKRNSDIVLDSALLRMEEDADLSLERTLTCVEQCEIQLKSVTPALLTQRTRLEDYLRQFSQLRDKMVYVADVRTSAAYDEARSIASALNVMGKPRKSSKARTAPPLRHWSTPKISNNNLHLKTEAQILELLSASANQGGPNKLSDDQSKALASWLASNEVQNLCLGEERLQKLCMEIRKSVDTLTADASPLWTSTLFSRDRPREMALHSAGSSNAFPWPANASRFDMLRLHTQVSTARDGLSSTTSSHPLSAQSSRDFLDARSPTLTSRSSVPFWSPTMTDAISPSSATSVGSSHPHSGFVKDTARVVNPLKRRDEAMAEVRKHVTSLLLSELTATMFNEGSETDLAFWTGLGGDLAEKHLRSLSRVLEDSEDATPAERDRFDFQDAFETLIRQFSTSCDPAAKLSILVEIDTLLGLSQPAGERRSSPSQSVPQPMTSETANDHAGVPISDSKVNGFRKLFCKKRTRPQAVFRDLQYITSLIPSIQGEYSAKSRAFWHASLAITRIKKELCNVMVETADSIIAHHSNIRGHGQSPSSSAAQQQRDSAAFPTTSHTPPAEDIAQYSMADAAHLLQITAKEGDAVAQRELATLYLTNPELMEHIIAPLARPREVFKEELESKWRKNQDPNRCDPGTMCVAHHWMSLSARGGDALAREFLKQREEMERLP